MKKDVVHDGRGQNAERLEKCDDEQTDGRNVSHHTLIEDGRQMTVIGRDFEYLRHGELPPHQTAEKREEHQ